jgi:hypothetical protein
MDFLTTYAHGPELKALSTLPLISTLYKSLENTLSLLRLLSLVVS